MNLPYDLISQFAKITKDDDPVKKETTVYGTVVSYAGSKYVKLDGSELLTPMSTTVDTDVNDRVTVLIKNHTATVTGNLTSPAGKSSSITVIAENVAEFEKILADIIDTDVIEATKARIDVLEADNVTIKNDLSANAASINTLEANDVNINKTLTAQQAAIDDLKATTLTADTIRATYATIASLNSTNANVTNLLADVANIDTLIFGSASGTTIQTSFANSVIAQLGDAQIKSAMIESVSADKITAGDIITNNVRVKSEDGGLIISDETMQISDGNRVRVQIGKDAANDYSINIWDQNGNLMFSKGGITDSAIKEAIIRNDMVSDTANIAAHKLDIDSLFEEINDSTNTIKSTKVYLDDKAQTLDVAFKSLSTTVTEQGTTISSQGTAISAIQGQITSKIWQQDIDTVSDEMSTRYSILSQDLNGFKSSVGETYATKTDLDDLEIGGRNLLKNTKNPTDAAHWTRGNVVLDEELNENVFYMSNATSTETTSGTHRVKVEPGETYTISAYLKRTANVRSIDFFFLSREKDTTTDFTFILNKTNIIPSAGVWTKVVWTFVVNENAYEGYLRIDHNGSTDNADSTLCYTMVKMEKGDKATDWTPAPEDMSTVKDVAALSTRITQTESSITSQASQITSLGSRTSTVEQTASGLTTRLNNLSVGGRNLIAYTSKNTTELGGYPASGYSEGIGFKTIDIPTKDEYVLSFEAKSTVAGDKIRCYFYSPNTTTKVVTSTGYSGTSSDGTAEVTLTTSWKRYWVKYTQTGNATTTAKNLLVGRRLAGLGTGSISLRLIKFEEGNQPTDWTPAPEDVDTDILAASKTATNYLNFSSAGLVIGDHTASTLGKNVLIDSTAVKVRTGTTVNAVFGGDIIELAKNNESATISMLKGAFKIYYDADSSDGGFGVYGVTPEGAERLAFQPVNENGNLTLGWGGYAAKANSTNLYGHKMYLTTNEDIILNPGSGDVQMDGNVVLTNGKNLFGKRTDGVKRSMAILNASNQMLFGYGSYVNNEGTVYYDGNDVSIRSKNDIRLVTTHESIILQDGDGNATYNAFFKPNSDAKCTLGTNANRWYAVYASNSVVQTSDVREKENIASLNDIHSTLFDKLRPIQFNFIDGNGRVCYGLIAQEVIEAMSELGISENDLDLVHHDEWIDEETNETKDTFGLAYNNIIAMLIHEVQKLKRTIITLQEGG